MMPNGLTVYPADGRPVPSRPDDGREWILGACWLWCRRVGLPVIWIGPVVSGGAHAPLFACSWCLDELDRMVWQYVTAKDANLDSRLPG